MNLSCKTTSNCKIPIVQVDWWFKLIQYSLNSQYCLRKLNEKSWKTGVYIHHFSLYKNSNSSNMTQYSIRLFNKNNQWAILRLSHISLYATLLVFLHSYQLQWRKTSYSKKKNPKCKIGINHIKKISDHCFWYSFSLTNSLSSVVAFLKISPMEDLKRNWVVISNDWNNKFRKETSQKSLFKFFF